VWDAARCLLRFLEAEQAALLGGAPKAVLELGSGTGWLGMALASNARAQLRRVHVTEMEHGNALRWLYHNVHRNRAAGCLHGAPLTAGPCDWGWWAAGGSCEDPCGDSGARAELESEEWDLIVGSDLVYNEAGIRMLPRAFAALMRPRTIVLYAHTLNRFEHYDGLFFEELPRVGLMYERVWCEEGTGEEEAEPFSQLFPEMRVCVFRIMRHAS